MNRSMIRFLLSKLLIIEAGLLLIPLIVAFIYHEPNQNLLSISATIGILLAVGLLG
ncbi:Cation transport protein, partial [human gut metagenome]